jgi:hypothetical protein
VQNLEFKIKSALVVGDLNGICQATLEVDNFISSTNTFEDESVTFIISLIDESMSKGAVGSNALINLFQTHWSKLSGNASNLVLAMCNKHVDNSKCLGSQTAIAEILNGEYLR